MPLVRKEFEAVLRKILKDKNLTKKFLKDPQTTLQKLGIEINAAGAENVRGRIDDLMKQGKSVDEIIDAYWGRKE